MSLRFASRVESRPSTLSSLPNGEVLTHALLPLLADPGGEAAELMCPIFAPGLFILKPAEALRTAATSLGVSWRHFPTSSPASVNGPIDVRTNFRTLNPAASIMRRTSRFFPSASSTSNQVYFPRSSIRRTLRGLAQSPRFISIPEFNLVTVSSLRIPLVFTR